MKKVIKNRNNKNKGFTIVELIVVMAIIAILILIAVPAFTKYISDANETSELGTANTIYKSTMATVVEATVAGNDSTVDELTTSINDGVSGNENVVFSIYFVNPIYTLDTPANSDWGVYVKGALVSNGTESDTAILDENSDIFILAPVNSDGTRNVYANGVFSDTVNADGTAITTP